MKPAQTESAEPRAFPKPLRAVLLDLDGTVADTHGLILRCYDHAIRAHLQREGPVELWNQRSGLPLDDILAAAFDHYGFPYTADVLETVKRTYREHMRAHLDTVAAFPGMRETLQALKKQRLRLAIVTTKHREMALRHLETLGLTSFFEAMVAGDECAHCKPHPEPFLKALAALNVKAAEAIGVGDSPHDIRSARGAGVYAIGALWGTAHRDNLLAAQPDAIAEGPMDILNGILF